MKGISFQKKDGLFSRPDDASNICLLVEPIQKPMQDRVFNTDNAMLRGFGMTCK